MDIKYIKEIADFMSEFANEHQFTRELSDSLYFKNEFKCYKVEFIEAKSLFIISVAPIDAEGEPSEFNLLSSWYFNEADHGSKDTKCIADDFVSYIAADSGIKLVQNNGDLSQIALPAKAEEGTEPGIQALAQKFLALFPQYKDVYKESVAKYGEFLYVDFFKRYGIEKMKEFLADEIKNKKQLKKYFDMLGDIHYNGDRVVGDVICAVIIAGSFEGNVAAYNTIADKYLEDYPFLKTSGAAAVKNYNSNKKLREALKI